MPLPEEAAAISAMTARTVSMAPRTTATRAGAEPLFQRRPIASQPQAIATGPSTIPRTKNPAAAQTSQTMAGVARSGPVRGLMRFRDRGVLRVEVLCPKPAGITP